MIKKDAILNRLYSLQRFGIKPGLERTLELLELIGNPHLNLKTIHVAGTNGKGSTCSIISSYLTESGFKTGLYTSPHIYEFNERIRIDGIMIKDSELIEIAVQLLNLGEKIGSTFFEITTVLAFEYFKRKQVDYAVIETGMGGQFDSTNVITPLLSIITKIDFDHKEYLGDTLEKIAFEKAGIIKSNIPVVVLEPRESLNSIFTNKANEVNAEIFFVNDNISTEAVIIKGELKSNYSLKFKKQNMKFENLAYFSGQHQSDNLRTAVLALSLLQNEINLDENLLKMALINISKNTGLKARIELISSNPPLIVDVGHNEDSIKALVNTIKDSFGDEFKWNILFAAMKDKDIAQNMTPLLEITNKLFLTQPNIERAETTTNLELIASNLGFESIIQEDNPQKAYEKCKSLKEPMIIVGSFYLLGEIEL